MADKVAAFMKQVIATNPGENEFHQAVQEVVESLMPVLDRHPKYREARVLERMIEPERVLMFRVPWVDDKGKIHGSHKTKSKAQKHATAINISQGHVPGVKPRKG